MVVRRHKGGLLRILWGTWDDFWQETSISGASNAGKAKGLPYIRRLCWMAIFGIFFGLTIFNVAKQFVEFYQYPVNYEVYVTHDDQVTFPSVTVCNQNRVHCGNLKITIGKFHILLAQKNQGKIRETGFTVELSYKELVSF